MKIQLKTIATLALAAMFAWVPQAHAVLRVSNATAGNWNATTSWVGGVVPAATDTAQIVSGANITNSAAATIAGVQVDSGGTLVISGNLTLNHGTSPDLNIAGTVNVTGGSAALTLGASATVTIQSGGFLIHNGTSGGFVSVGSGATITCASGGTYRHNFNQGTIPTIIWNSGSTNLITGQVAATSGPGGMGQAFANVVWNCPNQTATSQMGLGAATGFSVSQGFYVLSTGTGICRLTSTLTNLSIANITVTGGILQGTGSSGIDLTLTISGNLSVSSPGTLDLRAATGNTIVNVAGNVSFTGGTNYTSSSTGLGFINFTGTAQNFSGGGVFSPSGSAVTWTIPNGCTVTATAGATSPGIWNINAGGTLDANGQTLLLNNITGGGVFKNNGAQVTLTEGSSNGTTNFAGVLQDGTGGLRVTKAGTGAWILNGTNTYTGPTTISGGSLVVGITGLLGSGNYGGNITNNATLVYSNSAAQTLSGVITGTGGVTVNGGGTLNLTGANTYSGVTTPTTGTIVLSNATAFGTGTVNFPAAATGTVDIALDSDPTTAQFALTSSSSASSSWTIASDKATPASPGITHTVANVSLAQSVMNVTAGPNVSGGSPAIYVTNLNLTSGTAGTIGAVKPTTANLIISNVTAQTANKIFQLDGTSTGNQIVGNLGQGAVVLIVNKVGSGTWTFAGANTYSGGTTNVAGQLNLNSSTALGTGAFTILGGTIDNTSAADVTIANNNALNVNGDFTYAGSLRNLNLGNGTATLSANRTITVSANTLTLGGAVAGAFSLTKAGNGTLTLTGTSTYSGTTTNSAGTLTIGGAGKLGSGSYAANIANNGTFNYASSAAQTLSGVISGSGNLTQSGVSTLTLTGANTYSGTTTVSGGAGSKLVVSSAQTGTGAISVTDNSALGVTVSGASQLTPSSLTLGTSTGAILEFNGIASTSVAPVATAPTVNGTVTINVNSGTFTLGSSYPLFPGTSTAGYTLNNATLAALGVTAHLDAPGSTVNLVIDSVSDIWTGTAGNGNWDIATTTNWTGKANGNTPANTFADGDPVLFDDSATGITNVTLLAQVNPVALLFNNSAKNYAVTSSVASFVGGSAGITKNGSATVALVGGFNTNTGVATINAGTLSVSTLGNGGAASDLGAATSDATNIVINGGKLQFAGAASSSDRLFTVGTSGATLDASGSGALTLNNNNPIGFVGSGARSLTLNGNNTNANSIAAVIADNGGATALTKSGSGTWTLAGSSANTHSGTTTVLGNGTSGNNTNLAALVLAKPAGVNAIAGNVTIGNGTAGGYSALTLGASDQIADSSVISFSGAANNLGTFQLLGNNETVAGLSDASGNGAVEFQELQTGGGASTLTLAGTGSYSFNGFLRNRPTAGTGTGLLNIALTGGGTQTLSGANIGVPSLGIISISGGSTLALTGASANLGIINFPTGATGTNLINTTSQIGGLSTADTFNKNAIVQGSASTTLAISQSVNTTFGGTIQNGTGTLTVTKSGTGTLTLTGTNAMTGTFSIVGGGAVSVSSIANALGSAPVINLGGSAASGALIYTGTGETVTNVISMAGGTSGANAIIDQSGSGLLKFAADMLMNGNTVTRTLFLQGSTAGTGEFAGKIANTGGTIATSVTKQGSGTWTLSATNSYSGATTNLAGTLIIGGAGVLATNIAVNNTYPGAILNNAELVWNSSMNQVLSGVLSGSGNLTKTNSGVLTVQGANTYTGTTTVSGGMLDIANSSALGDAATGTTIANGAELRCFSGIAISEPLNISGVGIDGGVLRVGGVQTLTLNGGVTLGASSTILGDGGSAYVFNGNITNGGFNLTANLGGATASTVAGVISGNGGLVKEGTSTLNLNAANTYTGNTVINGGTLVLGAAGSIASSAIISIGAGATFNPSAASFTLGSGQVLSNSASATGNIGGNAATGSGTVSVSYVSGTPSLNVSAGTLTLSSSTVVAVNATGSPLTPGTYKIISKSGSGAVAGTAPTSVTVLNGPSAGTPSLAIVGGELFLTVGGTSSISYTGTGPFTYDGTAHGPSANFTGSTGAQTSLFVGVSPAYGPSVNAPTNAGSYYLTNTVAADANYFGAANSQTFVINPAALSITANSTNKPFGTTLTFAGTEFTSSGLIGGDSVTSVTLTSAGAAAGAGIGNYPITPSAAVGSGLANYTITYNDGNLNVYVTGSTLALTSSSNPAGYLDVLTFTASVSPTNATGSVTFYNGATPFSTNALVAGIAVSDSLSTLARGTNIITAAYLGDMVYTGSTNTLAQVITNHPPVATNAAYTRNAAVNTYKIAITNLLTHVSDTDGDTLTLDSVSASTNSATVLISGDYVMYYNTNAVADQFSYTVTDGNGGTNSANVNLAIDTTPLFGQSQIVDTSGGTATLNFAGIPGYNYSVGRSTNLVDWTVIWTTNAPTGGAFQYVDNPAPQPNAYYRLQFNP